MKSLIAKLASPDSAFRYECLSKFESIGAGVLFRVGFLSDDTEVELLVLTVYRRDGVRNLQS